MDPTALCRTAMNGAAGCFRLESNSSSRHSARGMRVLPGVVPLLVSMALLGVHAACAPPPKLNPLLLPDADVTESVTDSLSHPDSICHSSTERPDLLGVESDSTGAGWV